MQTIQGLADGGSMEAEAAHGFMDDVECSF